MKNILRTARQVADEYLPSYIGLTALAFGMGMGVRQYDTGNDMMAGVCFTIAFCGFTVVLFDLKGWIDRAKKS